MAKASASSSERRGTPPRAPAREALGARLSAPPSRPAPRARRRFGLLRLGFLAGLWGLIAAALVLLILAWDLPRAEVALAATRKPSTTLLASDGRLLATNGDLYGETLRLREMPAHLPAAFIAIEDRRFRDHWGIDPIGLARAVYANFTSGRVVQGGSTLTQQLAKNLFLTPERSLKRKAQEAMLALWLEQRFSKDELLEVYLNRSAQGAIAHQSARQSRRGLGAWLGSAECHDGNGRAECHPGIASGRGHSLHPRAIARCRLVCRLGTGWDGGARPEQRGFGAAHHT